MSANTITPVPQTYVALREAVAAAMIQGQRQAEFAKFRLTGISRHM